VYHASVFCSIKGSLSKENKMLSSKEGVAGVKPRHLLLLTEKYYYAILYFKCQTRGVDMLKYKLSITTTTNSAGKRRCKF